MAYVRLRAQFGQIAEPRLVAFQNDFAALEPLEIFEKYMQREEPCLLTTEGKAAIFAEFRDQWSNDLELVVVGSAQLGFSIKPSRRFQFFDFNKSDIDIAVIHRGLFMDVWEEAHRYGVENRDWNDWEEFNRYVVQGWINPYLLPAHLYDEWFDFFLAVQNTGKSGEYKVRAALYPSIHFLSVYQMSSIEKCR